MTNVTAPERTEEFLRLIGDPQRVAEEIRQAQASGRLFSSEHPHLIEHYLGQWVAVHDGEVIAASESFEDLLAGLEHSARTHVLVRFIARSELKMIL